MNVIYVAKYLAHSQLGGLRKDEEGAHLGSSGDPIPCLCSSWLLDLMALGGLRNASPTSHPSPNDKFMWGTFAY